LLKKRSKSIALLLNLAMLATMFVGVGSATAATDIQALSTPTVVDNPDVDQTLGTIKVTVPAGAVENRDSIIFKLPSGFDFMDQEFAPAAAATKADLADADDDGRVNGVVVPDFTDAANTDANGLSAAQITLTQLDANDEYQITATADQNTVGDFIFFIYLEDIEVEDGTDKDCVVTFDGPANTGFPQGEVLVGRASSTGNVTLTVSGKDSGNNDFDFDLRIKEDTAGSLELGNEALELELPDGYVWTEPTAQVLVPAIWGDDIFVSFTLNDEKLDINFEGTDLNGDGNLDAGEDAGEAVETTTASCWELDLDFTVDDDSDCENGAIVIDVDGETDANVNDLEVGTYGDFDAKVSTKDVPTIFAGQAEQEIADIVINEALEDSLIKDRTVIITLPEGARWQPEYDFDVNDGGVLGELDDFDIDEGLKVEFTRFTGTDNRSAKFTVTAQSTDDEAEIKLEEQEVAVEAGFEGDLVATVTGSTGITGEITLAKVVAPVTAKAENVQDVVIGKSGQPAGDFIITENAKEGFIKDGTVCLDLPGDVLFIGTPTVEVTEGDLKITNVRRANGDNWVLFDIDRESNTPSTIKVSGIKLKLYRTVPEGAVVLKVKGDGVVETSGYSDWTNSDWSAKATIANVVTAAGGDVNYKAGFVIGSATFKVNDVEKTMDVAPYIKNDRTYVPIRYIANAMGIDDANILWDGVNQTVTLMKGDKVVQLKIGSQTILINGAAVNMDVAPEITSDRTFLPARFVAQAFGFTVDWDAATQTVTLESN